MHRVIPFVFLFACAHAPVKQAPSVVKQVHAVPVSVQPCLPGTVPERAKFEPVMEPQLRRLVDGHGREIEAFIMAVTPRSFEAVYDYMVSLEADRERARTGCVAK